MHHRLRRFTTRIFCLSGVAAALCSGGCGTGAANAVAETGMQAQAVVNNTANAAVQIVQATAQQVLNIPQLVYDLATGRLTAAGNSSWGKPEMIVVTDTSYVFVYHTPQAEWNRTHLPRVVVIQRNDQTDPTRRI